MAIPARMWLPIFALCADLLTIGSAHAAQYSVEGFVLGERIAPTNPNYQSYTCKQSDDFDEAIRCERTQVKSGRAGKHYRLQHADPCSGRHGHLYHGQRFSCVAQQGSRAKRDRYALDRDQRKAKQSRVAAEGCGQRPLRSSSHGGSSNWMRLTIDAADRHCAGQKPTFGRLVDALGDLKRSAQENLPIYRIRGGSGYVYAASFDTAARGNRHYVAANGAHLGERLFARSLAEVLKKDQALAVDDYRLWPEVAVLTRRLSLDTSPDIANAAAGQGLCAVSKEKAAVACLVRASRRTDSASRGYGILARRHLRTKYRASQNPQ